MACKICLYYGYIAEVVHTRQLFTVRVVLRRLFSRSIKVSL